MAIAIGKFTKLTVTDPRTGESFDLPLAGDGVITGEPSGPSTKAFIAGRSRRYGKTVNEPLPPTRKLQPKVARHRCGHCNRRMTPAQWREARVCPACEIPF